ncbi:hypothetical protein AB4148_15405 [Vibrio sp. 10N.286.51.F4]|uniref:hypothetical protein n=1 Tax=Vibrio sp. 10N.286.51.F4 TaxID=3229710 RepID=UPI00354C55FC
MSVVSYIKISLPNIVKYNFHYIKKLLFLIKSKGLCQEEVDLFQRRKLKESINNFNKLRGKKSCLLSEINITTKDNYRKNNSYRSTSKFRVYKSNTGGTTGNPLNMFKSRRDLAYESAFVDFYLLESGVNVFLPYKSVRIRGDNLTSIYSKKGFLKHSLSSYKINSETCIAYKDRLKSINPEVIFCYPSSLFLLCKELEAINCKSIFKLKVIVFSSEVLYEYQLDLIKKYFKSEYINLFGNTEHTILAVDYCKGLGFEINPFYSFVESIDGRMITTSFNDNNMPFVRYDGGDLLSFDADKRAIIQGRSQDVAVGKSGQRYPITGLIFGQHFEVFTYIKEFNLIQDEKGIVKFNYYSESKVPEKILETTDEHINNLSNNDIKFIFTWKKERLNRTAAGKLKFFTTSVN